jgi:hypothetical protein
MPRSPLESARALVDAGDTRAALNLLRVHAERDHPPFATRRALAELYRELGAPDQAGRWGIVIEGWTTERERDRVARVGCVGVGLLALGVACVLERRAWWATLAAVSAVVTLAAGVAIVVLSVGLLS